MLVNWKVDYINNNTLENKQPPDYYSPKQPYWFYRYFKENVTVDVIDVSSFSILEKFEKKVMRFYFIQALRAIPKLNKYDLVVSHGMQSGIVIALIRCFKKSRAKHIVFDIGAFNSAAEHGIALRLMQFASKSIDGIIYHTSSQIDYYKSFFPWLVSKSRFIKFGTDAEFFGDNIANLKYDTDEPFCLCVGYSKRDWKTLITAFTNAGFSNLKLKLIGNVDPDLNKYENVIQMPFIQINDLKKQIQNSKFAVLPLKSFNYSYGQMTLMQQMAIGKCVIMAKVPSLVDYAIDGYNCVCYEPEDVNDLKSKMIHVNEDDTFRERIGMNAAHYIKESCNEKIMATEVENYYSEFIKDKAQNSDKNIWKEN